MTVRYWLGWLVYEPISPLNRNKNIYLILLLVEWYRLFHLPHKVPTRHPLHSQVEEIYFFYRSLEISLSPIVLRSYLGLLHQQRNSSSPSQCPQNLMMKILNQFQYKVKKCHHNFLKDSMKFYFFHMTLAFFHAFAPEITSLMRIEGNQYISLIIALTYYKIN